MTAPNLFDYATLRLHGQPRCEHVHIRIHKQLFGADIVAEIGECLVLSIEDKIHAGPHTGQFTSFVRAEPKGIDAASTSRGRRRRRWCRRFGYRTSAAIFNPECCACSERAAAMTHASAIVAALLTALGLAIVPRAAAAALPCDIAASAGTPCVVAYSVSRALYASYTGPLFQVYRASDNATRNIGVVNGVADMSAYASFCSSTICYYNIIYDQSLNHFNLLNRTNGQIPTRPPNVLTMTLASGVTIPYLGDGYLNAGTRAGLSSNGPMPVGGVPLTEYEVFDGNVHNGVCCYDFGEAETKFQDDGSGTMFAIGTSYGLDIDTENGGLGTKNNWHPGLTTEIAKMDGQYYYTLKYGDATRSTLIVYASNGVLPAQPMKLEGGLTLGIGGDSAGDSAPSYPSNHTEGAFIEGVVIAQQTADATDNAIEANIGSFYGSSPAPSRLCKIRGSRPPRLCRPLLDGRGRPGHCRCRRQPRRRSFRQQQRGSSRTPRTPESLSIWRRRPPQE
jgi:hypothetical protein